MHIIIYSTVYRKKKKHICIHIGSAGLYIYFGIRATVKLLEKNGYYIYNLPNIKWDVLDDGIVEQGPLGRHFAHISRRDETRIDEVMPYLRNVGQVFGLKVHCLPFIVQFPLALFVGQHPKDFGIVGVLIEPIISLGGNWLKVIVSVDRLCTEVYQNPTHPNPFHHVAS